MAAERSVRRETRGWSGGEAHAPEPNTRREDGVHVSEVALEPEDLGDLRVSEAPRGPPGRPTPARGSRPRCARPPWRGPARRGTRPRGACPRAVSSSRSWPENTRPLRRVQVPAHARRVHGHAPHDVGEAAQHVVEGQEAVGHDHALDRRVADVALVPQRHVLERGQRVRAHQAGQSRHLLAARRGCACAAWPSEPFWPARNGSSSSRTSVFCSARTSVANFSRLAAHDGEGRHHLGVAVALQHLRRDGRGRRGPGGRRPPPPPPAAGARTCPPRPRACPPRSSRAAAPAARGRAPAPRTRARASARTSWARRARRGCARSWACGLCSSARSFTAAISASTSARDQLERVAHEQGERGVHDVRGGEAVVEPAPLGPDVLGHVRHERDDVVLDLASRSRRCARRRSAPSP